MSAQLACRGELISGDRRCSIKELERRAKRAASGLAAVGVGVNDGIALVLRNDFAFFEASLAAAAVGAYVVPFNWHLVGEELTYLLKDSGAKMLVIHADLYRHLHTAVPPGVKVLVVATPTEIAAAYRLTSESCAVPDDVDDWASWLAGFDPWTGAPPAMRTPVIYTSGTTGRPKGVVREPMTPVQLQAYLDVVKTVFGLVTGKPARTLISGPLYHSASNAFGLTAIRNGWLIVMQPRFDPEELLALVERHCITHLHMVPIMFVRLLALPEAVRRRYDVSSLRFVPHAAAPCPPDVKRAMIEWWGPVICEYYGSTESGPVAFHDSAEALRKPGTVGRVLEHGIVRIFDDDGKELGPRQIGQICLGHQDFNDFTYRNRAQERAAVDRDGLITVGDIGYLDEEGYLFLCDRAKDMVISGGVNIYPAEIESALLTMPGVRDCAVFGIPDPEFGESVCVHIELHAGVACDDATVQNWLRTRISGFKVPKRIVFDTDLPREDSGKIFKRRLRDRYWAELGRRI